MVRENHSDGASESSPVLALTIVDGETLDSGNLKLDSRMMVAVRDPKTNLSHPDVISVPTQRVPPTFLGEVLAGAELVKEDGPCRHLRSREADSTLDNGETPLIFAVESLMSKKLGVGDALERKEVTFHASLRLFLDGVVENPETAEGVPRRERLAMANILVAIDRGAALFPARTASYSRLLWTSIETFLSSARTKSTLALDPGLDPIRYCIYGLCIASTYRLFAERFDVEALIAPPA